MHRPTDICISSCTIQWRTLLSSFWITTLVEPKSLQPHANIRTQYPLSTLYLTVLISLFLLTLLLFSLTSTVLKSFLESVTNFIWTITLGILDRFRRSKWPPKALKKTFLTVSKTSQSNQYSLSYQQISQ